MAAFLTTHSRVQCPHGGQATLLTSNAKVTASSGRVLLESDIHTVAGCAFTIGPKPSPCIRIEWTAAVAQVSVGGVKPLVRSSVGLCYSPENAPQGTAIVTSTQPKAQGR